METIARESEARTAGLAKLAANRGEPGQIDVNYLCAEVGRALSPQDIVFNEGIRSAAAIFNQVMRTVPGSSFGMPGSALGYSGGAALGAKLARPDALAVQIVGDGSFYQCTPETVYAVSRQYALPILTVVVDNAGWAAVKESTLRMYPAGDAIGTAQFEARLATGMDFSKIAESAGAYGAKVEHPDALQDAIQHCLKEVRNGRSALLHAKVKDF
jgi:acetolactate synthase-1/2/3 large subunit